MALETIDYLSLYFFARFLIEAVFTQNRPVMYKCLSLLGLSSLLLLWACQSSQLLPVYPLASSDVTQADFSVFKKMLKNKRVVMLGEFSHGAKEISQFRKEFIQYLHEELGYELVLFESGIGEGITIEYDRLELSAAQMVTAGVTGPWHTEDYVRLMDYIRVKPTLHVAGFDVQRTGRSFDKWIQKVVPSLTPNPDRYLPLEGLFGNMMRQFRNRKVKADEKLEAEHVRLTQLYQELTELLIGNEATLSKKWGRKRIALAIKTLSNRQAYLEYFMQFKRTNDYRTRWAARDSLMAENALWVLTELYPNKKVIINAHNFHISKYNEKELTMGEILAENLGKELYSIGVFGGKGVYANNGRKREEMTLTKAKHDIQQIVLKAPEEISVFPIPSISTPVQKWLFEPVMVNHSFISLENDNLLVPAKAFDALIGIKEISAPKYIN